MTVKSAPYYWLECDTSGCTAKSGDEGEHSAWSDAGFAEEDAENWDWITRGDKHYCPKHSLALRCPECGEDLKAPGATCPDPECANEPAKENHRD